MPLRFVCSGRKAGEPTLAPDLFPRAWDEFIELQLTDKQTWVSKTIRTIEGFHRYEIGLYDGDTPVGGLTLTWDDDPHVGECLLVMSQYVLPEYRNQGVSLRCMHEVMRIARRLGHTVVAFTHRQADWTYHIRYRRVHGTQK